MFRVDRIGGGLDYGRLPLMPSGRSLYWTGLNKGKRSIAVDYTANCATGYPAMTGNGSLDAPVNHVLPAWDIDNRQRLAIEHDAGRVVRTALVIDLDDPNDPSGAAQAYERVRKALPDRLGNPALAFDEGAIGATLVADVNAGRLIRVMEWQTTAGRVRLGIPRRLDGQVRIEVQHAASFGPPREMLWSVEAVR